MYSGFLNIPADAIRTAINTLRQRVAKFGANSREVREWLRGQDSVFASEYYKPVLPPPAPVDIHSLIKSDRAYQIAAAHFYAGTYDKAESAFRDIARDSTSPWAQLARYLVVRTIVRKTSLEDEFYRKRLAVAEKELRGLLKRSDMTSLHQACRDLLDIVAFRLRPEQQFRVHGRSLLRRLKGPAFKHALSDYTTLFDRFTSEQSSETLTSRPKKDDLTDWIVTLQTGGPTAFSHAFRRWKQSSSLQWLVASISLVEPQQAVVQNLLGAAANVGIASPAYPTIAYHVGRILIAQGQTEEARAHLDTVLLRTGKTLSHSSLNALLSLRSLVARDLSEYFKYSIQIPCAVFRGDDSNYEPENLQKVAKAAQFSDPVFLNTQIPLSLLAEAAMINGLGDEPRQALTITSWVRAVLLEDYVTASKLSAALGEVVPESKQFVIRFAEEKLSTGKKFAAVFCLLHFPGFQPFLDPQGEFRIPLKQIDNYRDNWWCTRQYDETAQWLLSRSEDGSGQESEAVVPSFLTKEQTQVASTELARFRSRVNAPNFFCLTALEWSKEHPNDDRVPEALHLAVRSTRYGCVDETTGRLSQQVFRLLHKKYPQSNWAQSTPYWFKY
ncbi:MAG: hypothetical protein HY961_15300 [Ignavibacteriae bacterium]|nr:hypothetical protein [Ignavibacteriota bacterium]